ncbi:MAG: tetratricopeptide repeat protein [Deltaproteobacteria bacterium]|nr:tetratricopeptide repeat protein [Deltaproteobacteria bacterium]
MRSPARIVMLAVVLVFVGCKRKAPPRPTPPTLEEAEAFGKQYASAKVPCDVSKLDKLVDLDLILARAVEGTTMSSDFVRGVRRGMKPDDILCADVFGPGSSAVYLRTQTIDGTLRPLIRLVGDEGYTYERLELDRRADKIVVADIYNFANGAQHSGVFGNMLKALADQGGATELTQITRLRLDGKLTEALALFQTLPAKLRATKEMMLLEVQLALTLDNTIAMPVFERFVKAFPDDPSLLINNIDRLGLAKEYEQQLAAIDKLDRAVGGDPYLELARADAYEALGRSDKAFAAVTRAATTEPLLVQAQWLLLSLQIKLGQFREAVVTTAHLKDKLAADITRETLGGDDRFKALVDTPEFIAWESAK